MSRVVHIAGAEVVRAHDFSHTGSYLVVIDGEVVATIYRDPENREWYEATDKHYSQSWLGSTKTEAVERIVKREIGAVPHKQRGGTSSKEKLREMEAPAVLGYELHRESLTPVRQRVDVSRAGDYGADPVGDGTFKMVPSGDIVDFEERNRRLKR